MWSLNSYHSPEFWAHHFFLSWQCNFYSCGGLVLLHFFKFIAHLKIEWIICKIFLPSVKDPSKNFIPLLVLLLFNRETCLTTTACSITGEDDAIVSDTSMPCSTIHTSPCCFMWLHVTIQTSIKYPENWRLQLHDISDSQACPSWCC